MITVIARWEEGQLDPELEWKIWRQLKGAFNVGRFIFVPKVPAMDGYTFEQADSVGEALEMASDAVIRIFLEPNGTNDLMEIGSLAHPDVDVVFVLGNTQNSNRQFADSFECFRIDTPGETHLYGVNAAAIALACWSGL